MSLLLMAEGVSTWDTEAFNALEAKQSELNKKIEVLTKQNYKAKSHVDPVQSVPAPIVTEAIQVPHVTVGEQHGVTPGWVEDPKKGYKGEFVAGQIVQDLIKSTISGPDAASQEFGQYCSYLTGLEQTSGITSTLTNGIEIVPEVLSGVKEQAGARLAGLELMNKETTSKGIIEYYRDENTYQVDGLVAAWSSEGATLTTTRDPINKGHLELDPLYVFAALTQEIMQDAPLLESRYISKAPQVMMVEVWKQILSGNGVGRPLGILNGGSTVSVTRTTASRIKYEDVVNMEARYLGAGTTSGFYVCNQTVLPQLMQIQDVAGAYIWKNNNTEGIVGTGAISGFLLGRPVIVTEDCEALGTVGDFVLINPAGYLLAEQARGIAFATSPHFYFDTRKEALRWDSRVGGQPYFASAYTPRKGGSTLSNFVNVAS
jgi:HK97 family phage major capsid protein